VVANVLLVEDNDAVRSTMVLVLTELGHTVVGVETAEQALRRAVEGFDVIITDLRLPGMNGMTLKRLLDERGSEVPLFLMSAESHVYGVARKIGAAMAFQKPLDPEELEDAIQALSRVS
jgi:DNA-binding response OmpR family regulator